MKKFSVPFLKFCQLYTFSAIRSARMEVKKDLCGYLESQFHCLSLFWVWRVLPRWFFWQILFAKFGRDRVLKLLIRRVGNIYNVQGNLTWL